MVYSADGIPGTEDVATHRRLVLMLSNKLKRDVWLCKGSDVTSYSDIQQPSHPWSQGQGGVHPTKAEYGGWSSDGTAGAMAGIIPSEARGRGRGRRLGQQYMGEDGDGQEQHGDIGV